MMSRLVVVLGLLVVVGCGRSGADEAASEPPALNTLTADEEADGWRLLFDGRSTDGWRNFKSDHIGSAWQVEDGALTLTEAGGGDIVTEETFEHFELALEWKIAEGGNSGIFFNVVESEAYNAVFETGPEYQLLDDERAEDNEDPTHRAGANYDLHAPAEDATRPAGQWNTTRIVVRDGRVQHYLNGTEIVDYKLWTDAWREDVAGSKFAAMDGYGQARSGHIALQDHGDRVWFRNIKIRPLSDDA